MDASNGQDVNTADTNNIHITRDGTDKNGRGKGKEREPMTNSPRNIQPLQDHNVYNVDQEDVLIIDANDIHTSRSSSSRKDFITSMLLDIGERENNSATADFDTHLIEYDYYATLNLTPSFTDDELRNTYKRLTLLYHPDKHASERDRDIAREQFERVQKAYNVLSNPHLRTIYDLHGHDGLRNPEKVNGPSFSATTSSSSAKTDGSTSSKHQSSALGPRYKTAEELREEYEEKLAEKSEVQLQSFLKSKGGITVFLDATKILDPRRRDRTKIAKSRSGMLKRLYRNGWETFEHDATETDAGIVEGIIPSRKADPGDENRMGLTELLPEIREISVKHSWETALTSQTSLVTKGTILTRSGLGDATIATTIRHNPSNDVSISATGGLGYNSFVSAEATKQFNETGSFVTLSATSTSLSAPPELAVVYGKSLSNQLLGYTYARSGPFNIGSWGAQYQNIRGKASGCGMGLKKSFVVNSFGRNGRSFRNSNSLQNTEKSRQGSCDFDIYASFMESKISFDLTYPVSLATSRKLSSETHSCVVLQYPFKVKSTMSASTISGLSFGIHGEFKWSRLSKLLLGATISSRMGCIWNLTISRLGQSFSVPVLLSPFPSLKVFAFAFVIPTSTYLAWNLFWHLPRRHQSYIGAMQTLDSRRKLEIAAKRKGALQTQRLMKESAKRKVEMEKRKGGNGLVILKALYGREIPPRSSFEDVVRLISDDRVSKMQEAEGVDDHNNKTLRATYIDVTIPMQTFVNESKFFIPSFYPKSSLMGFYDVSEHSSAYESGSNQLLIIYGYGVNNSRDTFSAAVSSDGDSYFQAALRCGGIHVVQVDDEEPVAGPVRSHRVV